MPFLFTHCVLISHSTIFSGFSILHLPLTFTGASSRSRTISVQLSYNSDCQLEDLLFRQSIIGLSSTSSQPFSLSVAAISAQTCITPLNGRRGSISGDTINTLDIASSLGFSDSHESRCHLPPYSHDLLLSQHLITMITTRGPPLLPPVSLASPRPGASASNTAHSRRSMQSPRGSQRVKKQSKWSAEEDAIIIGLRGAGMKWEDVSKRLPGRSAISCRLHYQNYLERRSEWDEERKNKLARLYER